MEVVSRYYASSGLQAATGNCLIPIPTGIALGGTTAINSGTCLRAPQETLRAWEASNPGAFDAAEFEGYQDEAWRRLNARLAPEETASVSSRLFLSGLRALGISGGRLLDRAENGCVGSGRCCFVCPRGAKMTADGAFLRPLQGDRRLQVETGTELEWVEPPSRPAGSVTVGLRRDGRSRTVTARCLVLACGALSTPYFVRRFQLGPRWRLAGSQLSLPPAAKLFALFDQPVRGWSGVPQGAGLLDPEEPRVRYEGVYTPPEIAAVTLPLEGRRLADWMARYDRVATFGYMIRDRSRGYVRYPLGPNLPAIRYSMGREDLDLMLRGMRFLARVFFAAGARRVLLPFNGRPNAFDSAEELDQADLTRVRPAQLQMMAFHPLGTCGMGRVVDADLKLCDGVYVADGSVVPESLGVNPQVTIYAFALRLGAHLLKRFS